MKRAVFRPTRNPNIEAKWERDIWAKDGIGMMTIRVHGKEHILKDVPRKVYFELLRLPQPDFYYAQLRTIYR